MQIVMESTDRHPMSSSPDVLGLQSTRPSYTDAPPAHYTLKINSFSTLSDIVTKSGAGKYESDEFESGEFKWKIVLYPNGDSERNGDGHISLYLALADTDSITNESGVVDVIVRLFVYNHIRNQYLIFQDGETKRYHVVKTEHGFNKLLPLPTFKDSRNGYLVQDCCAFGAEVYVIESTGLGQEFSLVKDPRNGSYSWMIHRFSTLRNRYYYSNVFNAAGYKWQLMLNPKGDSGETNRSLSLYLKLDGDQSVYAEANLSVKDQLGGVDHMYKVCKLFGAWGTPRFMLLSDLRDASKGYLVNDILVVEAKLTQVSSVKDFS